MQSTKRLMVRVQSQAVHRGATPPLGVVHASNVYDRFELFSEVLSLCVLRRLLYTGTTVAWRAYDISWKNVCHSVHHPSFMKLLILLHEFLSGFLTQLQGDMLGSCLKMPRNLLDTTDNPTGNPELIVTEH